MLRIRNLTKNFSGAKGSFKALDGISLDIKQNAIVGLVGESGSGKSTLGKVIIGLVQRTHGDITWNGRVLPKHFSRQDFIEISRDIQMVFQDPYSTLNPRMPVWQILEEPCLLSGNREYQGWSSRKRMHFIQEYLELVGLRPEFYKRYPHEFSGGQLQRIGIARAIIRQPKFLICDEPVSALDVSVQAQIVNLLKTIHQEFNMGMLFIGHDLAMVNYLCEELAVMYLGKIVEQGACEDVFFNARHPYTRLLISCSPDIEGGTQEVLPLLEGEIPSAMEITQGCSFAPRCWQKSEACEQQQPPLLLRQGVHDRAPRHLACFHPKPDA